MKTFIQRFLPLFLAFLLIATPVSAGGAISFQKFNEIFSYKSYKKLSKKQMIKREKKKEKLIKKLIGKKVEWQGTLKGKYFHCSQTAVTLDMGPFAAPSKVRVILKRSQQKKLKKINLGSTVKVRAVITGYGKLKYHELKDGVILKYKQAKKEVDMDPNSFRFKHWEKDKDEKKI